MSALLARGLPCIRVTNVNKKIYNMILISKWNILIFCHFLTIHLKIMTLLASVI